MNPRASVRCMYQGCTDPMHPGTRRVVAYDKAGNIVIAKCEKHYRQDLAQPWGTVERVYA